MKQIIHECNGQRFLLCDKGREWYSKYKVSGTRRLCGFQHLWLVIGDELPPAIWKVVGKADKLTEYEVKVSRSDFKVDALKSKWRHYTGELATDDKYRPNYFYYACPTDLIKAEEVPAFAGLVYVEGELFTVIKKAKRLHPNKVDREKILSKISRVHSERMYLGCCRMTYENKLATERYNNRYPTQPTL